MSIPLPEYLQIFIGLFALVSPPVFVPLFFGYHQRSVYRGQEDRRPNRSAGVLCDHVNFCVCWVKHPVDFRDRDQRVSGRWWLPALAACAGHDAQRAI